VPGLFRCQPEHPGRKLTVKLGSQGINIKIRNEARPVTLRTGSTHGQRWLTWKKSNSADTIGMHWLCYRYRLRARFTPGGPTPIDQHDVVTVPESQRGDNIIARPAPVQLVIDQQAMRSVVLSCQQQLAILNFRILDRSQGSKGFRKALLEPGFDRILESRALQLPHAKRDK